jgi:ABC-type nitrate/sulfonate/bicarbonate transport system ATPase subunit
MAATGTAKPISIRGLGMTFTSRAGEAVEALRPIDMEIAPGSFVALVGPSGCGKSTLLNVLAGFIAPTAGSAHVGDRPITGPDMDRGMVFQDYALFPWLSVIENVAFGLERKGLAKAARLSVAQEYLQSVGLEDFAGKRTTELSGGMKQRVAIARAFATEPSIILMDEPFGALDALTRRFLQHQLLQIWQAHRKTIVFVTHSVQEAVYLADRVVVMTARPGRIKLDRPIELPHPRDFASDPFRDLELRIYGQLDEELAKTFNLEAKGGSAE